VQGAVVGRAFEVVPRLHKRIGELRAAVVGGSESGQVIEVDLYFIVYDFFRCVGRGSVEEGIYKSSVLTARPVALTHLLNYLVNVAGIRKIH
jgi:hypothetical protein